jgi:hypothetical protein
MEGDSGEENLLCLFYGIHVCMTVKRTRKTLFLVV